MDAATTHSASPPSSSTDTPHRKRDNPPRSPGKLPVGFVARRRITKASAVGSPVRRSPRLSSLPPPQPPLEFHCAASLLGESSDDDSESIDDIALHLSREETPENETIPPDEPSSVLASRILRAHDNPSPPPQDPAYPGINHAPGKGSQFSLAGLPVPPSPFRPINILEGLNQFSDPVLCPSRRAQTPVEHPPETSEPNTILKAGSMSPDHRSLTATKTSTEYTSHVELVPADMITSCSPQSTLVDLPSQSSQHLITRADSVEVSIAPPTQAIDPSLTVLVPLVAYDSPSQHLFSSDTQRKPSALSPSARTFSPSASNRPANVSLVAEVKFPDEHDVERKEPSSTDDGSPSVSKEQREHESMNSAPYQRLNSFSPHSNEVLAALCLPSDVTSLTEQRTLPSESLPTQHPPSTPPQTPRSPTKHPDFSRTSVQRPVVAPTPVQANNGARKILPAKFLSETHDICRTPAQRVPITTALACGTPSFQKTIQLSTGLGPPQQLGRFPIRTPVFTRPALDGPSRSPAKRILVTESAISPARGHQVHVSPIRIGHRTRSTSAEPRPLEPILARSRSVEPSSTSLKSDDRGKLKESIFPAVSIPIKSGTKLPFPLDSDQKLSGDRPPPIPEECDGGDTVTDSTPGRVAQGNAMTRLKHPSISSRIPRMGKKPYARPLPRDVKPAAGTTSTNTTSSKVPPFQLARKNNEPGNGGTQGPFNQALSDQCVGESLKRKRGAETVAPSGSHPFMARQVVPGVLGEKYAPKPTKTLSRVQTPSEPSSSKALQPLKFRKVIDGMLSARYPPANPDHSQTRLPNSASLSSIPDSPLSELSSSSDEGLLPRSTSQPPVHPGSERSDTIRTDSDVCLTEPHTHNRSSSHQDANEDKPSGRPRRTPRAARKLAQQQYVLDVFNVTTSTRPPPARRKPSSRTEGDGFMGMSATALKALTTSNTAKNQQIVAVLATEVIRKEGLRPESPMVKVRTILQKQRDERDRRRRKRAEKRARMSEDGLGSSETEGQNALDDQIDHDENDCTASQKYCRGPGDDEDYKTPERTIEPLRFEGVDGQVKPMKHVKWDRGLSTAIYLDEVDTRPKSLLKDIFVRGCLAPASKNLPLDSLGNLVSLDNRPCSELVAEHIVVKKYLYDNDIEPEPIPPKVTRSKSKKGRN